jgi:UDP-N-acetylglucosamine 1-carboxyvinyltransferase
MTTFLVTGGRRLSGTVRVGGAKNSALKLMAAALLAPGTSIIRNVPDISDVGVMCVVLEGLGARVSREDHSLRIDATDITSVEAPG